MTAMRQIAESDMRATARRVVERLRAEAELLRRSAEANSSVHPYTARIVADTAAHIELTAEALDHLVATYLETLPAWRRTVDASSSPTHASIVGWLAMFAVRAVERGQPLEAIAEQLSLACDGDHSLLRETARRVQDLDGLPPQVRVAALGSIDCALGG